MQPVTIIQTVLGVLVIAAILLQQRGTGIGGTFGGESSTYATRRGAEKILFVATIILIVLFVGVSVVRLLV